MLNPPRRQDFEADNDESRYRHRQLIGYIGLFLPFVLILVVHQRDGAEYSARLESISAYYYSGANAAFVGTLISLALLLFTYRGYRNQHQWADILIACIAGAAAVVAAAFPTAAPLDSLTPPWWTETTRRVHYGAATGLFSMFAIFSGVMFCLGTTNWRKWIYRGCAIAIVVFVLWAWVAGRQGEPIFWPESGAVMAFAISWLVKGRAHRSIANSLRSVIPGSHSRD